MPNRYTRNFKPDLVSDTLLAAQSDRLFEEIAEAARLRMPESNGWSAVENREVDSLNHDYHYGDFKGSIALRRGVDLKSVPGQGMVQTPYVMISLTCQDSRKVNAQVAGTQVVQRFEKVFSVIGALVVGLVGLFVQTAWLRVISLEVTAGCFIAGFFLGGLVGYLLGEPISNFLGRGSRVKTEADQIDLGIARVEWSEFIESMIEPIELFSRSIESVRSTPTVI